jgi:serine/threonine protein kinase
MIFNEINFLRELLICENIVHLDRCYVGFENGAKVVKLVMLYAKYGSILKHLHNKQRFNEEEIRTIMAQLILAIDLMHRKNIIHRDIKPDNILVMDK